MLASQAPRNAHKGPASRINFAKGSYLIGQTVNFAQNEPFQKNSCDLKFAEPPLYSSSIPLACRHPPSNHVEALFL